MRRDGPLGPPVQKSRCLQGFLAPHLHPKHPLHTLQRPLPQPGDIMFFCACAPSSAGGSDPRVPQGAPGKLAPTSQRGREAFDEEAAQSTFQIQVSL